MSDFARLVDGQWARIEGGFVAGDLQYPANWLELASAEERAALGILEILPADSAPAGSVDLGLEIVDLAGTPKYQLVVETLDLAAAQIRALAELADARWSATQFFTFDGVETQADGAIGVITARLMLRQQVGIPDEAEMAFKLADGEFRAWDKAAEVAFGLALSTHVQGCFDLEATASAAIAAAQTAAEALAIPAGVTWP